MAGSAIGRPRSGDGIKDPETEVGTSCADDDLETISGTTAALPREPSSWGQCYDSEHWYACRNMEKKCSDF
jgi:hypothetical protein